MQPAGTSRAARAGTVPLRRSPRAVAWSCTAWRDREGPPCLPPPHPLLLPPPRPSWNPRLWPWSFRSLCPHRLPGFTHSVWGKDTARWLHVLPAFSEHPAGALQFALCVVYVHSAAKQTEPLKESGLCVRESRARDPQLALDGAGVKPVAPKRLSVTFPFILGQQATHPWATSHPQEDGTPEGRGQLPHQTAKVGLSLPTQEMGRQGAESVTAPRSRGSANTPHPAPHLSFCIQDRDWEVFESEKRLRSGCSRRFSHGGKQVRG